jgi:hypothetical protein
MGLAAIAGPTATGGAERPATGAAAATVPSAADLASGVAALDAPAATGSGATIGVAVWLASIGAAESFVAAPT